MPNTSNQSKAAFAELSALSPAAAHAISGALVLAYLLGDEPATVHPILQSVLAIVPTGATNLRAIITARSAPSAAAPHPIKKLGPSFGKHFDLIAKPADVDPSALPWPAAAAAYLGTDVTTLLSWADYVASKGYTKAADMMYSRAISALGWIPTSTRHRELMTIAMLHHDGERDVDGTLLPINVNATQLAWNNAMAHPTPTNAMALAPYAQALSDNGFTTAARQLTDLATEILHT